VVLNYLALHGRQGEMQSLFPGHGLGGDLDKVIAFNQVV
jgi:hypothetical protein